MSQRFLLHRAGVTTFRGETRTRLLSETGETTMATESRPIPVRGTTPQQSAGDDPSSVAPPATRIVSLDQFRGYTVAGMFVVNFLGGYAITHYGLKHNDRFFTWADSIMPSFMFACGFSYRLSVLRRLPLKGAVPPTCGIVKRSLGLVLVSLAMYGLGSEFKSWAR